MNRSYAVRALLVGLFCLCAATLVAEAKPVEKVFRIGVDPLPMLDGSLKISTIQIEG